MTREEALDLFVTNSIAYLHVQKIYKDFESRTCENCKYSKYESETFKDYESGHIDRLRCWNEILHTTAGRCVDKDFGCNKFERKPDDL